MQRTIGSRLPILRPLITAVAVIASFPLSALVPAAPVLSPHPATAAASFTVTSTADAVDASPGNGVCATAAGACTLRAAIQEANALAGADAITLPAGTYTLSLPGTGEDAAATGDLDIAGDVTLTGAGATTTIVEAGTTGPPNPNGIDRVFHVLAGANVQISELTVRNGTVAGTIGGGFFNSGSLTLRNIAVVGNSAPNGGGIANWGALTVIGSTFTQNTTPSGGPGAALINGSLSTATFVNSTISGNAGGGIAGAVLNRGILHFLSSTIAYNTTSDDPSVGNIGGIVNDEGATLVLRNTILSRNLGGNCLGAITSQDYNLSSDVSCGLTGPGDLENTDPELGPLQDNGGPTLTHALPQTGSPATDAGNPAGCTDAAGNPLTTDQRGFSRPVDGDLDGEPVCDIGAYEAGEPVVCTLTQEASYAGGNMTLSYTLGSLVAPVTWYVYLLIGEEVIPIAVVPLGEIDPPYATGPLTFPVPPLGPVVWFTALVGTGDVVLCWDFDQVDTGTPTAGGTPPVPPAVHIPLPNGLPVRP